MNLVLLTVDLCAGTFGCKEVYTHKDDNVNVIMQVNSMAHVVEAKHMWLPIAYHDTSSLVPRLLEGSETYYCAVPLLPSPKIQRPMPDSIAVKKRHAKFNGLSTAR